jgi:hypothetical protein
VRLTILLIEHDYDCCYGSLREYYGSCLRTADRSWTPAEIRNNPKVIEPILEVMTLRQWKPPAKRSLQWYGRRAVMTEPRPNSTPLLSLEDLDVYYGAIMRCAASP